MKIVWCVVTVGFICFVGGFWLAQSLAESQQTTSLSWDDVKLTVKQNSGLKFDGDYGQMKLALIEASKHLSEYNHPTWAKLRGYYLYWMAEELELKEYVNKQQYEQATKGLKLR